MDKKELKKEIIKKYSLSEEQSEEIYKKIEEIMMYGKHSVDKPIAIINIAPPGSGKTGLNAYGRLQFNEGNVIIVNGDEIRAFYPGADDIAREYPEYYAEITDQENRKWTKRLFDTLLKEKYNVIFEGTGRTTAILDTIKGQMKEYDVIVRTMAVDKLNCLMSILARYKEQCKIKGYGRLTPLEAFDRSYMEILHTLEQIEQANVAKSIEVFKRGETPNNPIMIYSSEENNQSKSVCKSIINGRNEDKEIAMQNYEEYKGVEEDDIIEVQKIVDRINGIYEGYNILNAKGDDFEK